MNKDSNKKLGFTLAEGATHVGIFHNTRRVAFTLAEVLITLAIIGVVSALTIPTLVKEYQKKVTVTKLQKVHATLNQIAKMSMVNGGSGVLVPDAEVNADTTEKFIKEYWLPYIKSPKLTPVGKYLYPKPSPYIYLNKAQDTTVITTDYGNGRTHFFANDGISYFVMSMYWDYVYDNNGEIISSTKRNRTINRVVVDLNGIKEPNIYGKDVFCFRIDFEKGYAYPWGYDLPISSINGNCSNSGIGCYCAEKIRRDGWQIKDDYPW